MEDFKQNYMAQGAEALYRLTVDGVNSELAKSLNNTPVVYQTDGIVYSNTPLTNTKPATVPNSSKFQPGFLEKLQRISNDLGIDYRDLLIVMSFETGGTFSPSKKSPVSSATGLIQFLESTARGLGTTTSKLARMSQVEQLDWVYKYLKPYKGKMQYGNYGDVYLAVFSPKFIGKPDSIVCYRRGEKAYKDNAPLDTNKDGLMTRQEIWQKSYKSGKELLGWN